MTNSFLLGIPLVSDLAEMMQFLVNLLQLAGDRVEFILTQIESFFLSVEFFLAASKFLADVT